MDPQILNTVLMGAAGDGLGGLASGIILAAGSRIANKFQAEPVEKAFRTSLEDALLAAAETLPDNTSKLTQYYVDCFASFMRQPAVHQELAVLLNPRLLTLPEAAAILDNLHHVFTEITKGVPPGEIPDIDFDAYIAAFLNGFYGSAQKQAALQNIIEIRLLDRVTLQLSELMTVNQRIEMGAGSTARNTAAIAEYTAPLTSKLDVIAGEIRLLRESLEFEQIIAKGGIDTDLAVQIEALNGLLGSLQPKSEAKPAGIARTTQPGSAPPLPNLIIGREGAMQDLKQRLSVLETERDSSRLQVLTAMRGWPGVGKTTLAAALSYESEIAQAFPDGTLWATLGQSPDILSELAAWGRALGTDTIFQAGSVAEASAQLRAILKNQSRLLIIDDVWKAEHAMPFKVGGPRCATLITTRLPVVANDIASPQDIFVLPVLDDEKAYELLKWLAPSAVAKHPDETRILAKELEGLPLALQVAGRLLHAEASMGFEIPDLIEELRAGAKLIEARPPADRIELADETTPTVAALLQKSTDGLDPVTLDSFAYLGVFAPKPATFDLEAMAYMWEVEDPKPIVRTLVARGLLEHVPEIGRFQMHALLVMHAKSFLT